MPLSACHPGEWYLVVTCTRCKTRSPILPDMSEGKAKINAVYAWRCPVCEHVDQYQGQQIERYQHPFNGAGK